MKWILALLLSAPVYAQYFPQRVFPKYCEGSEMFNNLGRPMYRFTFSSDCTNALAQSQSFNGRFCDDEKLVRENGQVSHQFTFRSHCNEALVDLRNSRYGLYCDSGLMNQIYRGRVANLTFESDCKDALLQANQYRGFFCNNSVMMTYLGERLRDYTFESNCKDALRKLGSK